MVKRWAWLAWSMLAVFVVSLIVAHRPINAVGWTFSAIALLACTGQLANEYALVSDVLRTPLGDLVLGVPIVFFPVATGIAILRHRLYDIDRLIHRTLVYGLLTALLAGVYVGVVLVLGQLFGGGRKGSAELGGGRCHPGRGRPLPAGPPPHPGGRGPAIQPAQVRRRQDDRHLRRPAARPGRS